MNLTPLIQALSWTDRKLFKNAFKREKVEFNQNEHTVIVDGKYGVVGTYETNTGAIAHNTMTTEGQLYLLKTGLASGTAEASWYIALWNNAVTPAESWDAATFASTAGEITSATEGYTGSRPAWTPDTPLAEPMKNSAAPATFNIVSASSVSIQGPALISSATKGGTSGVLLSAAPFNGGVQSESNGNVFKVVFTQELRPL